MVRPQGQGRHQQGSSSMTPSSKHWTDMFKNKHSSSGADINTSGRKSDAFTSILDDETEGRTQEPKVRWNPRPEQIRILETIFNSGMVNPPREEISKIRARLQAYGQVGDSNVFYWFQNRKSRSKLKNRQQNSATRSAASRRPMLAPSSSSSSSDRSSSNGVRSGGILELHNNSSSGSVNQNYNIPNTQNDPNIQENQVQLQAPPPYYYQNQQTGAIATGVFGGGQAPGLCFNEIMGGGSSAGGSSSQIESFSRMLLGNQMMVGDSSIAIAGGGQRRSTFEDEVHQTLSFMNTNPMTVAQTINAPPPASSYQILSTSQVQGVGGAGMVGPPGSTVTVHINGVKLKVSGLHPFPVQEAFGEHAVLFHQSGNPVPTNNWGVTLHPLSHGASYFVEQFPPAAAPNQFPFN